MSGIINSTGSKSGIIGFTEIDYEEGTWTPVIKTGDPSWGTTITYTGGTQGYTYTKIGNLCHLEYKNSGGSASAHSGADVKIEGLPFTSVSQAISGILAFHGSGQVADEQPSFWSISPSATYGFMLAAKTGTTGYTYPDLSSTGASYIFWNLTYTVT